MEIGTTNYSQTDIEKYIRNFVWFELHKTMDAETEASFQRVVKQLGTQFGQDMDIKAILFLIGVQELGKGPKEFNKQEKTELIHIAVCALLEGYGYYEFEGRDADDWPHWKSTEKLPSLRPMEQERLVKMAIVQYFEKNMTFDN